MRLQRARAMLALMRITATTSPDTDGAPRLKRNVSEIARGRGRRREMRRMLIIKGEHKKQKRKKNKKGTPAGEYIE